MNTKTIRIFLSIFLTTWIITACTPISFKTPQTAKTSHSGQIIYTATVSKVSDGDTIHVIDIKGNKHKIRLAFIDAPETKQNHGTASRDALIKEIYGTHVRIEHIDTDRYGREVARIRLNGKDINLTQIQTGHAWHYQSIAKHNQPADDYAIYEAAQNEARAQHKGLWQYERPKAPWDYRKQKRDHQAQTEQP